MKRGIAGSTQSLGWFYTDYTKILLIFYTDSTQSLHRFYGNSTQILHRFYTDSTQSLHRFYGNSTQILHRFHSESTQILRKFYTDSTQSLHRFYKNSTQISHRVCMILLSLQKLYTLRFLINVLDQIRVLARNFVKMNKHTAPNKHIGIKLLAQKYNFLWI